jgi:hypothetical protein
VACEALDQQAQLVVLGIQFAQHLLQQDRVVRQGLGNGLHIAMMNEVIASPPEFVAPICIFLSGEFHPPTRRRCPPLASVKQRRELRRRQHDPPGRARRGPNELALLQPLGQHAQPDTA